MQRLWVVRPRPGEAEVSRDDMREALIDAEALMARAGGHLNVVTHRQRADEVYEGALPGEVLTVAALFEWKDRTDARPQPESTVTAAPPPPPASDFVASSEVEESEPGFTPRPLADDDGVGDGLVTTAEEDVSAVTQR